MTPHRAGPGDVHQEGCVGGVEFIQINDGGVVVDGSTSLRLARSWYAVVGIGALVLTAGHLMGALQGSALDPPIVAAGLAIGVTATAAAAWVGLTGSRAVMVWIGIAAGVIAFLVVFALAARTPTIDVLLLAGIPTALAMAAAARLGLAQRAAPSG